MSFYKTNDPAVLAAWSAGRQEIATLRAAVNEFAAKYGATGHTYSEPVRFAGLRFPTEMPRDLWRAPDRNGLQCPRSTPLKGATAETKAALKALRAEWDLHVPDAKVSSDRLYEALGVDWGDFLFTGLTLFEHDGHLYAETGAGMPRMTEILGSEYQLAKLAAK
ncbi:TPA: hypothetical protein UM343_000902 [Stenotrophomonas maltophilia]|nr:hypothetical protein [Stenotrophomonas maltophilia]